MSSFLKWANLPQSHPGKRATSVRHTSVCQEHGSGGEAQWVVLALLGWTAALGPAMPGSSLESQFVQSAKQHSFLSSWCQDYSNFNPASKPPPRGTMINFPLKAQAGKIACTVHTPPWGGLCLGQTIWSPPQIVWEVTGKGGLESQPHPEVLRVLKKPSSSCPCPKTRQSCYP